MATSVNKRIREARKDIKPYDRPPRNNPVLSIATLLQPTYY